MAETQLRVAFKGVDQTAQAVNGIQSRIKGMGMKIGGMIGGAFAVRAVARFGSEAVQMARVQEQAEKKLGAVIQATGGAAGRTKEQLINAASALQSMTNFGDEVIINGQAILATFKNINGDVFDQTTKAMLDMSAAMDQDVKTTALQLGKALNDPILGLTALSRAGVQFTDQQKDSIKSAMALGDTLTAQKIILKELQSQFGGVAAAQADPLIQLSNLWTDLKEGIGLALMELINFTGGTEGAKGAISGMIDGLKDASIAVYGFFQGIRLTAENVAIPFQIAAEAAGRLASVLDGVSFKDAFEGFDANPFKRMDENAAEMEKRMEAFASKRWEANKPKIIDLIKDGANEAGEAIKRLRGLMGDMVLAGSYKAIQSQFGGMAPQLGGGVGGLQAAGGQFGANQADQRAMLMALKDIAKNTKNLEDIEGSV